MRLFKKKLYTNEASVTFWLPPSVTNTHVAVVVSKDDATIYINGEFQDWRAAQHTPQEEKES